jgi:non-specific serine/threonine protein kinase
VILTQGSRDAPDRQRTLRAAIEWSYDLLAPVERTLFSSLAVFAGSFPLGAVTAIASGMVEAQNETADELASGILDSVSALIDQALLQPQNVADDAPRFSMLLTIRDFAVDQLAQSSAAAEMQRRHAMWFLDLAEQAESELVGPDAGVWLARLEQDHDNLRTALATFFEAGDPEGGLRLAAALWRFWWLHGHLSEGRSLLDRALEHGSHAPVAIRAKATDGAGGLASAQGDHERAAALHTAALDLWRSVGDRAGMANALINLGLVADERGDPKRAEHYLREALDLARAAGNRRGVAVALANLGQAALSRQDHEHAAEFLAESAHVFAELGDVPSRAAILANLGVLAFLTGDYVHAATLHETALASMRELSDRQGEADELLNLGHAVQQRGDLVRAGLLFDEALIAFRQLGDRSGHAFALIHLGRLAQVQGDAVSAEAHLRAGFAIGEEMGDRVAAVEAMEGLAMVACSQGNVAHCARLLGASSATRERIGVPLPAVHGPAIDRCVAEARRVLGSPEFAIVLGEGRAYAAADLDDASENGLAALAG